MKICIDAGHGGIDSGAVGYGYKEKDLTLVLATKLNKKIKSSVMTRTSDVSMALIKRANYANLQFCDLFLSIHINSAPNSQANGIETLVYSNMGDNHRFAELLQSKMVAATGARNRGIKERPELVVLRSTNMIAALVEVGFISNEKELLLLLDSDYQDKIVNALADAIDTYCNDITYVEAINILRDNGILNSPEYWLKTVPQVKYLDTLLINMAKRCD